MRRVLAVLVGAGVAVGGGVAAWAGPGGGPDRAAAKGCAAQAKTADPGVAGADLRQAVRSCLEGQGITLKERTPPTPEQQARRDEVRTCLQSVKGAHPDADRAALRAAALPCLEKAGIAPRQIRDKAAAVKACREQVRAANPEERGTMRNLFRTCLQGG